MVTIVVVVDTTTTTTLFASKTKRLPVVKNHENCCYRTTANQATNQVRGGGSYRQG